MAIDTSRSDFEASVSYPPAEAALQNERADGRLLDLLAVILERKRIVLWITAGFALVSIIVSLLLPSRYSAEVTLLPPQQNSSLASLPAGLANLSGVAAMAGSGLGLKNPNDTFVAMLKSRTVEDGMVQHFRLMDEYHARYASDARKKFEKYASVDGSRKDGLIHIVVEDHDPKRAAELANGYVEQFRSLSSHLAITEAAHRRVFFEQQLEQAKNSLANAEEAMKVTEQKTGFIELNSQARALIESAAALRAQIAAKEVQISALSTFATPENAQLKQAREELAALQAQMAQLGGSADGSDGGLLVPKGKVPGSSLEYVRKLRDVKYYETIFDILARQFEMAKLDEAKEGPLVQVVDSAVPPDKKSFPQRSLIVISATFAGLLIGVLFAFFTALYQHTQLDPVLSSKVRRVRELLWLPKRAT